MGKNNITFFILFFINVLIKQQDNIEILIKLFINKVAMKNEYDLPKKFKS